MISDASTLFIGAVQCEYWVRNGCGAEWQVGGREPGGELWVMDRLRATWRASSYISRLLSLLLLAFDFGVTGCQPGTTNNPTGGDVVA